MRSVDISPQDGKILNGLKNTTHSITEDLKRYQDNLQADLKFKINHVKVDSVKRMDSVVFYVIHGIKVKYKDTFYKLFICLYTLQF